MTALKLSAFAAILFFAAPSAQAESSSRDTLQEIKRLVKANGGPKLHRNACGRKKSKTKNTVSFAEIANRRYKMMILVDKGGQLHFVDQTGKRPVRSFLGVAHITKFKISANEVKSGLKNKPACFLGTRKDLDL